MLQAKYTYVDALTQLNSLKARCKGAPPPRSQAVQQIQTRQRIVDTARMKVEMLRKNPRGTVPHPAAVRAAA